MSTTARYGSILALALCTLTIAATGVAQDVRQPIPLPALGQNSATDRQVITVLQQQLLALGYPTEVTGRIGRDTRAAITAFAIATGISLDGPDTDRIVAIDATYAALRTRRVAVVPLPTLPLEPERHRHVAIVDHHMVTAEPSRWLFLPYVTGAGAITLLGVGVAGLAMHESIVTGYNAHCRGFGDPAPAAGCDEATNAGSAKGASALATTGFVAGGILGVVTAVLFAIPTDRPRRVACGGGPGDIGISCGGAL